MITHKQAAIIETVTTITVLIASAAVCAIASYATWNYLESQDQRAWDQAEQTLCQPGEFLFKVDKFTYGCHDD